tara:strand:- start:1416 stop:1580 length:165 start_codon:yes stop_codon:yes gene_type:complete
MFLKKNGQATYITPLQPPTLAAFPPWGIWQELVVQNLPATKIAVPPISSMILFP